MFKNDLEPRRHWSRRGGHRGLLGVACASCGAASHRGEWLGEWFCQECLDRSRQDMLDVDYDDLGVGD